MKRTTLTLVLLSSAALAGFGSVPSPDSYSIYDKLQENVTNKSDGKSYDIARENSVKDSQKVYRFGSNQSYSAPISTQSPSPSPSPRPATPPPVVTAPPSGGGGGGVVTPPPVAKFSWPAIYQIAVSRRSYKKYRWTIQQDSIFANSTTSITSPCGDTKHLSNKQLQGGSAIMCGVSVRVVHHGGTSSRVYIDAGSM